MEGAAAEGFNFRGYRVDLLVAARGSNDIGSGSGYLTHVLANLVTGGPGSATPGQVIGIDHIPELLRQRIPELAAHVCIEDDLVARTQHLKAELNQDLNPRGLLITRVQLAAA